MNLEFPQWFFLDHVLKISVAVGRDMSTHGESVDDRLPIVPGLATSQLISPLTWTTAHVLAAHGWRVASKIPGADKPA